MREQKIFSSRITLYKSPVIVSQKRRNRIVMEQKDILQLQEELRTVCAPLQMIRSEVSLIIAGQEKLIDRILLAMLAYGHVLL